MADGLYIKVSAITDKQSFKDAERTAEQTKQNINKSLSNAGTDIGNNMSKAISQSLKGTSFMPFAGAMSASTALMVSSIKKAVSDISTVIDESFSSVEFFNQYKEAYREVQKAKQDLEDAKYPYDVYKNAKTFNDADANDRAIAMGKYAEAIEIAQDRLDDLTKEMESCELDWEESRSYITGIISKNNRESLAIGKQLEKTEIFPQNGDSGEKRVKATKQAKEEQKQLNKAVYEEGTLSEGLITRLARRIGLHESMMKSIKSALTTTEGLQSVLAGINTEINAIIGGIQGFSIAVRSIPIESKAKALSEQLTTELDSDKVKSLAKQLSPLQKVVNLNKKLKDLNDKKLNTPDDYTAEDETARLEVVGQLTKALSKVKGSGGVGIIKSIASAINTTLIPSLSALWTALAPIAVPIIAIVVAIKALLAVLRLLGGYLKATAKFVKACAVAIADYYKWFIKAFSDTATNIIKGVGNAIEGIIGNIKSLKSNAKEGLESLYQWAKKSGDGFAGSMDKCSQALDNLNNALGGMVAPIINTLAPVIDAITDKVIELMNIVSMLFAMLTGASGYYKATKSMNEYADATESGADALKSLTTGIDELNVLNADSGSGGSGSSGSGVEWIFQGFENINTSNLGKAFGQKLIDILDSINWNAIQAKFADIGSRIAGFINGMISVENLGSKVGNALAQVINTGIEFLKGLTDINGKQLGEQLSNMFATAFEKLDIAGLHIAIDGIITDIVDTINGLFDTDNNAETVADGIGTCLGNAVNDVATIIAGIKWDKVATSITETLKTAIQTCDPQKVADAICAVIGFGWDLLTKLPLAELGNKAGQVINNILDKAIDWFSNESNADQLTTTLSTGLNAFIDAIQPDKITTFIAKLAAWFALCWEKMKEKVNWQNLGQKIGNALAKVDWKPILRAAFDIITDLWDFGVIFIKDVWTPLCKAIGDAIHEKLVENINTMLGRNTNSDVGKLAVDGLKLAIDGAIAVINPFVGLFLAMKDTITLIKDLWDELRDYIKEHSIRSTYDYETEYENGGSPRTFATGGYPSVGQMFVAREAGPELVGTIGNQTAVANNDQIVAAVSSGVYSAVVAAMGNGSAQNINVYLDGKQIESSVRRTTQSRGANIANGGLINYSYA